MSADSVAYPGAETIRFDGTELSLYSTVWVDNPRRLMVVVDPDEYDTGDCTAVRTDQMYLVEVGEDVFAGRIVTVQLEEGIIFYVEPEGDK
jgi:hypothetical protein